MGFGVWIGGVLSSQMNAYAIPLNAWVKPDEICKMTDAVIRLWRDNGERDKRPKGRFRLYLCLLYTSPSPRDKRQSRMPSSA